MPSVALAQGLGRIGCYLAGCRYGLEVDSPISIVFTNSAFAPNGVPAASDPAYIKRTEFPALYCASLVCQESKSTRSGIGAVSDLLQCGAVCA